VLGFGNNHVDARGRNGQLDALGQPATHAELSGFATHFNFDIGGAIVDNLVLALRFQFATTIQPNATLDGVGYHTDSNSALDTDLIGASVTYYFMPINVYVTGAFGWASVTLDDGRSSRGTGSDFGFTFDVGKEFWAGSQWGIGGALRFSYANIDHGEQGVDVNYEVFAWGVLFSATYQ
jgi:hypothetical protein